MFWFLAVRATYPTKIFVSALSGRVCVCFYCHSGGPVKFSPIQTIWTCAVLGSGIFFRVRVSIRSSAARILWLATVHPPFRRIFRGDRSKCFGSTCVAVSLQPYRFEITFVRLCNGNFTVSVFFVLLQFFDIRKSSRVSGVLWRYRVGLILPHIQLTYQKQINPYKADYGTFRTRSFVCV